MKATLIFIAIFVVSVFMIPMLAIFHGEPQAAGAAAQHTPAPPHPIREASPAASMFRPFLQSPASPTSFECSEHGVLSFRILDTSTGRIDDVPVRDFVRGALAMEMPMSFHDEALKAQAIAAHTWALANHLRQQRIPDPALRGADFAADPWRREVYITEEKAREFFGPFFEQSWERVTYITDSVLDLIIEHDGAPIMAAYHAISAGMTEYTGNVWVGTSLYLLPAISAGCLLADNFEVSTTFASSYVQRALQASLPGISLSAEPEEWFTILTRSDSGYITQAEVGGITIHGSRIRTMFNLRSHNLDITYHSGYFTFTSRGHGHGVGMPQYGANFLALQGYSFCEIIKHYYSGVEIRRVDFNRI